MRNHPPEGWAAHYPVPEISSIRWLNSTSSIPRDQPFDLRFEDTPSMLAMSFVWMSTTSVPTGLRPLVKLFLEGFFASDLLQDGILMSYADAYENLRSITTSASIGVDYEDRQAITIAIKHDPHHLPEVVRQLHRFLTTPKHSRERLRTHITKVRRAMSDSRREADLVAWEVLELLHHKGSVDDLHVQNSSLYQNQFLRRIEDDLANDEEAVCQAMQDLVRGMADRIDQAHVMMSGPLSRGKNPAEAWKALAPVRSSSANPCLEDAEERGSTSTRSRAHA